MTERTPAVPIQKTSSHFLVKGSIMFLAKTNIIRIEDMNPRIDIFSTTSLYLADKIKTAKTAAAIINARNGFTTRVKENPAITAAIIEITNPPFSKDLEKENTDFILSKQNLLI